MTKVSAAETEARKYLAQMVTLYSLCKRDNNLHYICWEDYIKQHGRFYNPRPLPKKYAAYRGEYGWCYKNAYELVEAFPNDLIYCEGIAASVIPTEHGWAIDKQGRVVDPTWEYDRKYKPLWYVGVTYDLELLRQNVLCNKVWPMHYNHCLLRQPFNPSLTPQEYCTLTKRFSRR